MVVPAMESATRSARQLLLSLQRYDLNGGTEGLPSPGLQRYDLNGGTSTASLPGASGDLPGPGAVSLEQLGVRTQLAAETAGVEQLAAEAADLRGENARLATDLRSLAAQLKQERANGGATRKAGRPVQRTDSGGDIVSGREGASDEAGSSGLTLANAASQILMLRREVKFLQKQWQSARRDADGAARRDEVAELRDAAEREARRADEALARVSSTEARQRLLVRELGAMKAKLAAQQARILKRSAAQLEAASLRTQLDRASEALSAAQVCLCGLMPRTGAAHG